MTAIVSQLRRRRAGLGRWLFAVAVEIPAALLLTVVLGAIWLLHQGVVSVAAMLERERAR